MKARVHVLTAYDSHYQPIASITVPAMHRFADINGYSFEAVRRDDCVRGRGWIKIEPLLAALAADTDYVLWLDTDVMPVRTDIDIRSIANPDTDLHMSWHEPATATTGDAPHYNTGVMLIRVCEWSRKFFEQVWEIGPLPHRWHDQAAVHHALGLDSVLGLGSDRKDEPNLAHVAHLDRAWNSIPVVSAAENPVITHFAGIEFAARLKAIIAASN